MSKPRERFFSERAFIRFVFPDRNNAITKRYSIKLPLYETPMITESKSPRYGKYKILGRNSDIYTFHGADSRVVTLAFNLTLPHLYETINSLASYQFAYTKMESTKYEKDRFKSNIFAETINLDNTVSQEVNKIQETAGRSSIKSHADAFNSNFQNGGSSFFTGLVSDGLGAITNAIRGIGDFFFGAESSRTEKVDREKIKAIYYFWINLIRASVVGSEKGDLGPPTIRFSFGPMYQDNPFIVTRYEMSVDDLAGYDLETLLPHRVKITLSLEELRVGDFGTHKPEQKATTIKGDNVAGWESVIDYGTMDPRIGSPLDNN